MLLLALRSFFFIAVVMGYSTGVWRLINDYFRHEFKTYLDVEVKKNKYLLEDPVRSETPVGLPTESGSQQPTEPVTSNRLLDELIVSFGRLFTAGHKPQMVLSKAETNRAQSASLSGKIPDSTRLGADHNGNIPDPGGGSYDGVGVKDQTEADSKGQQIDSAPSPSDSFVAKVDARTVIESDEFPRRSPMVAEHYLPAGDGDEDGRDDGEDEWVQYWKDRVVLDDEQEWGQCEGPPNNVPPSDGCELNLVPRG